MDPHVLPTNTSRGSRGSQGNLESDVRDAQSFSKGSKRLFSHTLSRYSQEEDSASNYGSGSDGRHLDEDDPFEKRHRTSDWPLGGNGKAIEDATAFEADGSESPTSNYSDDAAQPRSSRFIEGSMSNRVSQKPPRKYVVTEPEWDCAEEDEGTKNEKPQRNRLIRHSNHSVPAVLGEAKTETNRHSTIFRFGKSLAASFNPNNWKIWSKSQDAQAPDDKADADVAQAKLERAYREVKNIAPTPGRRFGPAGRSAIWSNGRSSANPNGMSISSVDVSEQQLSQKRYGMVFGTPPSMGGLSGDDSTQQSPSKASTATDLYSVPSQQPLHSNESRSSFTYGTIAPPKSVKHTPSRKDLRVQQKLVKRVSNLESKLEAARLELVKSMGNAAAMPPPARGGKSRFVPGTLSSLPSESLLSGYTHQNESAQSDIGAALTTDEKISLAAARQHDDVPGRPSISSFASSVQEDINEDLHPTVPGADDADQATHPTKKGSSKKRKSTTKASNPPTNDHHDTDQNTHPNPSKKPRSTSTTTTTSTPRTKPSPELLLPDSSSSSSHSSSNVDPEKKAVLVPLGTKQQGTPRLIVRKRAPLEVGVGGGSRIPRKGSRRETPEGGEIGGEVGGGDGGDEMTPAVETQPRHVASKLKKDAKPRVKSSENPHEFGDGPTTTTASQSTRQRSGDIETSAAVVDTQPRHTTAKLKKSPTKPPRVITTQADVGEEKKEKKKENQKPQSGGGGVTTSTSMESFEWGPDVF